MQGFSAWSVLATGARVVAFVMLVGSATICAAGNGSDCREGSTVRVCVAWSQGPDPEHLTDYVVTFSGSGVPSIVLRTGDLEWEVYAEFISNEEPADIAALTIDPSSASEDFVVAIVRNGSEPGAANVGTIDLTAGSWSGHSSIASGSIIAGDLTSALTVLPDSGGNGGELSLEIGEDVTGDISARAIGVLSIAGDLDGSIEVTSDMDGEIALGGGMLAESEILVAEDLTGTIHVLEDVEGIIRIGGDVNASGSGSAILVEGGLSGSSRISIDGSLRNGSAFWDIDVVGEIGALAGITIDYDGWHDGDDWVGPARIGVGNNTYGENYPAARVWEVSRCKGDLDGNAQVQFYDIDPFLAALLDPAE